MIGDKNGGADPLIEAMLQQIGENEREGEMNKMIFTVVSAQILGPLLAVEYQKGLDKHIAEDGDSKGGFTFEATRDYSTAKQMAVTHMQQLGYKIGLETKKKIQE